MALKSDDLSFELTQHLQSEADELSIELQGKVTLVQSKDGVDLLRDELPSHLVVEILRNFVEDAIREKLNELSEKGQGLGGISPGFTDE